MKIELDMYQTLAVAVLVLMLGKFLRARVQVLERFCIPAPVIGGVLFAIFTCVCYVTGIAEFAFDDILKEVCMVMFFTSVGFQANLKVLRSGGTAMIVFLVLVIVLIVGQNFVAIGLSNVLGISPLVPSVLMTTESQVRPLDRRKGSTAATVPETLEWILAETKPPASPILVPTNTSSPFLTRALAGAPMCWLIRMRTCAGRGIGTGLLAAVALSCGVCAPSAARFSLFNME